MAIQLTGLATPNKFAGLSTINQPTPVSAPSAQPRFVAPTVQQPNSTTNNTTSTSSTGGGSGGSGGSGYGGGGSAPAPTGGGSSSGPTVQNPDMDAINHIYDDSYNYLNQAEDAVRADYPNVLNEADATYNTNKSVLDTGNQDAMSQFGIQGEQVDKRGLEAKAANSRLYSDLNRGYQQRFGGSSSAGGAASEIANVEQQRQQGSIQRSLADTHQAIDQKKVEVDHEYHNNLLQLEQNKQLAVNTATRDFQNKLLEISKARADLGVNKAQAGLQAMQDYRNKVFQINVQNQQFQQTLEAQRQQAQLSLQNYKAMVGSGLAGGSMAVNNFANGAGGVNPTTNLQVNGVTQPGATSTYTGQIANNNTPQRTIVGYDANNNPIYSG